MYEEIRKPLLARNNSPSWSSGGDMLCHENLVKLRFCIRILHFTNGRKVIVIGRGVVVGG